MAMTGGAAYLVKSERTNYGSNSWTTDLYIYVKVISQNVVANTSTIALGMYVYSQYSIAWSDFGTNGTSYIGTATSGANCFTFTNGQSGSGTKWLVEDKQVTVSHNSNGTLTLPIYWHWGVNSPWGQYTGPSGSYNVTLSTIDRVAPTVTFSVSSITANGFKISANSTSTADIWQYSTNGGSTWMTFSTSASTSASVTLSSLSPNTNYTVKVRARRQYNQVYGTSGGSTVKTLGGAVVNSVSTVTADNARVTITINVTVYEPSYINSLAIKSGNTTLLTVTGLAWTKGTANRSVTLSSAQRTTLLNWMASIKSFTGTFAVSSFSGSTQIGSTSSKTATVQTTAANSAPTLSDYTYEDSYAVTKSITENNQLFIQDCSTLKVTPGTATAKNGASISNYTAACNGLSASSSSGSAITLGKITKSGSVIVTLTVVDSRGYTATLTKTITVIPYSAPKMYSATLRRTNDIEPEMQLKFSGSIAAISVNGTQKNSVVYARYRYKKTSDADYSGFTSIIAGLTQSGTSFSYSNLELCNLDANSSYDFQLQIQDKLYSQSSLDLYFVVPQGTPLIALRKKKVGINTPNPQAALDVAGDMRVSGGLRVGGASLADFVIQQGTSGIWSFRKWKSGMAECWGAYNFTVAITSAWGAVYESGLISLPTFPFTFAAIPTVFFSSGNGNAAFFVERGNGETRTTTTSPGKFYAMRPVSTGSSNYQITIYAIGKV